MEKLYLDFDLTIVNSIEKIVSLYDIDYHLYKDYQKVHWTDISTYGFEELTLINKDIILNYFDDHRFFYKLKYMDNAQEVLDRLKDTYDITIVSLGRQMNLHYKREWINNNLPYCKFIGVDLSENGKQMVDISDGTLIDDNVDMLNSCNASQKIIFGEEYPWNTDNKYEYHRCYNWTEVYSYLLA
jgi:5'(3')-deoxyribonucleotidase